MAFAFGDLIKAIFFHSSAVLSDGRDGEKGENLLRVPAVAGLEYSVVEYQRYYWGIAPGPVY